MFDQSRQAERERQAEVDAEAARLVREHGIPLWTAIRRASQSVNRRRQEERAERPYAAR